MLISSNGLSLSQWDSVYANFSAPLISKLRLETVRQSSTVIGEPSAMEIDGGTEVGVGGSGEIEVDEVDEVEIAKIENQTTKYKVHDFSLRAKYRPPDRPPEQSCNSSLIYHFAS